MSKRIDKVLEVLRHGTSRDIDRLAENRREFIDKMDEYTYTEARVGWSWLAGRIVQAHREEGFIAAVIFGRQGNGKSVYSIKVAYDALRRLGVLKPWHTSEKVFKEYMVFTARDFVARIRAADREGVTLPLVIWDDAGVDAGSYTYWTNRRLAQAIVNTFKVIRTSASAILFTTPSPEDLLKQLRTYDTLMVRIERLNKVWRRAHIYELSLYPNGFAVVRKVAQEDFRIYLPTYPKYREIRRRYVDYALDQLEDLIREAEMAKAIRRKLLEEKYKKSGAG